MMLGAGGAKLTPKGIVVVFGSINVDLIVEVQKDVTALDSFVDQSTLAESYNAEPGGKGANEAVALGKLGITTTMVGRVGRDDHGRLALEALEKAGVHVNCVTQAKNEKTGVAMIINFKAISEGVRTVKVSVPYKAANDNVGQLELTALRSVFEEDKEKKAIAYLLLQFEVNLSAVYEAAKMAKEYGVKVLLKTSPYATAMSPAIPKHLYRLVDILVANEAEAPLLLGSVSGSLTTLRQSYEAAVSLGNQLAPQASILVASPLGVVGREPVAGKPGHWRSFLVPNIDVTIGSIVGAADACVGGFVAGQLYGYSFADSMMWAACCAARSLEHKAAQGSLPNLTQLMQFMEHRKVCLTPQRPDSAVVGQSNRMDASLETLDQSLLTDMVEAEDFQGHNIIHLALLLDHLEAFNKYVNQEKLRTKRTRMLGSGHKLGQTPLSVGILYYSRIGKNTDGAKRLLNMLQTLLFYTILPHVQQGNAAVSDAWKEKRFLQTVGLVQTGANASSGAGQEESSGQLLAALAIRLLCNKEYSKGVDTALADAVSQHPKSALWKEVFAYKEADTQLSVLDTIAKEARTILGKSHLMTLFESSRELRCHLTLDVVQPSSRKGLLHWAAEGGHEGTFEQAAKIILALCLQRQKQESTESSSSTAPSSIKSGLGVSADEKQDLDDLSQEANTAGPDDSVFSDAPAAPDATETVKTLNKKVARQRWLLPFDENKQTPLGIARRNPTMKRLIQRLVGRNDVFISYKHGTCSEFVRQLAAEIQSSEQKITVWFDKNIEPLEDWRAAINRQIRDCKVFLLIASPQYFISPHCLGELAELRPGSRCFVIIPPKEHWEEQCTIEELRDKLLKVVAMDNNSAAAGAARQRSGALVSINDYQYFEFSTAQYSEQVQRLLLMLEHQVETCEEIPSDAGADAALADHTLPSDIGWPFVFVIDAIARSTHLHDNSAVYEKDFAPQLCTHLQGRMRWSCYFANARDFVPWKSEDASAAFCLLVIVLVNQLGELYQGLSALLEQMKDAGVPYIFVPVAGCCAAGDAKTSLSRLSYSKNLYPPRATVSIVDFFEEDKTQFFHRTNCVDILAWAVEKYKRRPEDMEEAKKKYAPMGGSSPRSRRSSWSASASSAAVSSAASKVVPAGGKSKRSFSVGSGDGTNGGESPNGVGN